MYIVGKYKTDCALITKSTKNVQLAFAFLCVNLTIDLLHNVAV